MFEKALIGTDFSPPADRLTRHALELTDWGVREIVLAHVIESPDRARLARELLETETELLREREAQLRGQGIEARALIEVGSPGEVLRKMCEKENPSLVVVGSHGKGLWKRALLGSTSDALMRASRWPLLLVRLALLEEEPPPERLFDARAVLYPTDFSANAAAVLRYLKKLPGLERVTLLHVHERTRIEPHLIDRLAEFDRIDRERLGLIRGELSGAGVAEVEIQVQLGDATRSILDWSEQGKFTLVALGLRGRTLLDDFFIGSVAANLSRYASLPLLLVPQRA
jgi:nucleotide-binding universal stress UspA family protein